MSPKAEPGADVEPAAPPGAALIKYGSIRQRIAGLQSQERMAGRGLKPETVGEILTTEPDQVWVLALGGR